MLGVNALSGGGAIIGGPPQDFIAHYAGNDVTGTTWNDETGNFDATISGAVVSGSDLVFVAAESDYVDLSAILATLEASGTGTIVMQGSYPSGGRLYFGMGKAGDDIPYIQYILTVDVALYVYRSANLPAGTENFSVRHTETGFAAINTQHTVAWVHDSTKACLQYLNGSLLSEIGNTGTPGDKWWDDNAANIDTIRVQSLDRAADLYYSGNVTHLYIYDRDLSAAEIASF